MPESNAEDTPVYISWVPGSGGVVPKGSLVGGKDGEKKIIVARGNFQGEVIPGKLIADYKLCYVPYGGVEQCLSDYEALVVSEKHVSWVSGDGKEIPENAIPGGTTSDGETFDTLQNCNVLRVRVQKKLIN